MLEALLGAVGASATIASAAVFVRKARHFTGTWDDQAIHAINARRGTTTPDVLSRHFNRTQPAPPGTPPDYVPYVAPPAPPLDIARSRQAQTHRIEWHQDGTWDWVPISPEDHQPPPYDGPRGR